MIIIPKTPPYLLALVAVLLTSQAWCQRDTSKKNLLDVIFNSDDIRELKGTGLRSRIDSLLKPELRISGYVSTYFAYYDDDAESSGFNLFPTLAPRSNQFSLNMALINMTYKSQAMRYNITLHYGDVPESAWPSTFNLIQEANAGFRIFKKLWFDAGFFKTHIGLESFQPRENVASSMSIPNFYDPYFLSGVKLTWLPTAKLSLQACVFNGYNEYLDNNSDKALDFSANYTPNDHLAVTYNFITSDETPDGRHKHHRRFYQNAYASLNTQKFDIGLDLNYGLQQNSLLSDTTKYASLYGVVVVGKYKPWKKIGVYARGEYFSDPDRILTGTLDIGKYITGTTVGIEIKPQKTAGLSIEWRILQSDKLIFHRSRFMLNQRNEFIVCLDLWF